MRRLLVLVVALACVQAFGQDAARDWNVCAVNPLVRVYQDKPVEGAAAAELFAARNEYESFQLVITAGDEALQKVNLSVQPLKNGDAVLSKENITLYREVFVPVRYSSPRATCPPGLTPDPLVPLVNPYTGEPVPEPVWNDGEITATRFGASNFELWPGHNAVIWVDVYVPTDAVPGVYEGAVRVTSAGHEPLDFPVRLTVWDFVLPEGPTHENHFGGFEGVAGYLGLDAKSPEFEKIEDRYIEMTAAHRINPPIPKRLRPAAGEDGSPQFTEDLTAQWAQYMSRHHLTNVDIPRAPFGDSLGADRQKAINFYRGWYAFLEKNGWASGAYLYMLDEPNEPEAYEKVRQLGALVHDAEPRIRRLVVEQTYTQNPEWGSIDDAVDIWCPLFGFVDQASIDKAISGGDRVWSYTALVQKAPPYHPQYDLVKDWNPPFWQLDFAPISYRIPTWLNRRYNITGLLYWSVVYWGSPQRNPWLDPGFRVRWNGDGALFYPGREAGIEGPVASIRLKNLRDGMEDYEYFRLAEERAGADAVLAVVREAVPDWGHVTEDPWHLYGLRSRLCGLIGGVQ